MRNFGPLMKTNVLLRYEGPALEAGAMDVYEASANMIAFSEFMVAVAKTTYGEAADVKAEVAGYQRGSFITELIFDVGGTAGTLLSGLSPAQLWKVAKGAFDLWKHLKGSAPAAVTHEEGQRVVVTNNNGQIIQVQTDSFHLVMSERGASSVGRFVKQALERSGVEALEIRSEDEGDPVVRVEEKEAAYFVPVAPEALVSDNSVRMLVSLVSPVFVDGNKWRFNDGANTFAASLTDEDFVTLVERGERFGKGDVLDVDMRIVQHRSGMKVSIERAILKVHRHITPHEQLGLDALETAPAEREAIPVSR